MRQSQRFVIGVMSIFIVLLLANCVPANVSATEISATHISQTTFISLAENANCAEDRNQLYLIDGQYFFHATEGWCMDAAYDYTLYGATPDEKLCSLEDSFVGPLSECESDFEALFTTMIQNLDQNNLGLGNDYSVELVFEKKR